MTSTSNQPAPKKGLRILGIVFSAISAVFTLLAGVGTTCVAFNPTGYGPKFALIAPFQWLWILFVLIGIGAGIAGIMATVKLIRKQPGSYRFALIVLLVQTGLNLIHLIASRAIRGGSMPVDGILYANILALIIFLIPGVKNAIKAASSGSATDSDGKISRAAASISLFITAVLVLTVQYWMAPTHTIEGFNYADVWHNTFFWVGSGLLLVSIGLGLSLLPFRTAARQSMSEKGA